MEAPEQDIALSLRQRTAAAQEQAKQVLECLRVSRSQLRTTCQRSRDKREARAAALTAGSYAWLAARLDSLRPVEQAKGILIAQRGCSPQEALDLLGVAARLAHVSVQAAAQSVIGQLSKAAAPAAGGTRPSVPCPSARELAGS